MEDTRSSFSAFRSVNPGEGGGGRGEEGLAYDAGGRRSRCDILTIVKELIHDFDGISRKGHNIDTVLLGHANIHTKLVECTRK